MEFFVSKEVSRLWQRVGRQAEELEVLRSQVERSRQLLERLRCLEGIRPTGSDMEQFESLDLD